MVGPGVDLIRRMAGGDREALAAFYDLYAPLAFGLLRRMLRDVDEAAEVLQDVFWELWRGAGEYDPRRGSPEAWVTVRARSRGIDRVRSVRRREEMLVAPLNETAAAVPEAMANPGALVEEREMVRGFLRELPAEQREAIALAYLQGMTQSQISAHLGLPLGTVKTRMRLGLGLGWVASVALAAGIAAVVSASWVRARYEARLDQLASEAAGLRAALAEQVHAVSDLRRQLDEQEKTLTLVRAQAAAQERTLALLGDPETRLVSLAGLEPRPQAQGRI